MEPRIEEIVGAVTIGRNEGERLCICLESLKRDLEHVVYVDSDSSDGSVEMARKLGVDVVELDLSIPFSAPRARNEGFERLLTVSPAIEYVQFLDGDCELIKGWLDKAFAFMEEHGEYAVVSGRRRERYPEQSIYNRISDVEWDTPIGDVRNCHGDNFMRVEAFREINGYNPRVMTGEEEDMCFRLRQKGWKIHRLDEEMSLHDMAISRFSQWWRRSIRTGFFVAELCYMYGGTRERVNVRRLIGTVFWGAIVPILAIGLAWPTHGLSLLLLLGYGLTSYRAARSLHNRGYPWREAWEYGVFCTIGKFPALWGCLKFVRRKLFPTRLTIIEYKS